MVGRRVGVAAGLQPLCHQVEVFGGDGVFTVADPKNSNVAYEELPDAGTNVTTDGGKTWTDQDVATAQFYHVITDNQFPYWVYGSQQDNTAISIPSRTLDGAIHEKTWSRPRWSSTPS